jgi:tripartite-type tricarboxylate transporter receptor subunit TctC
LARVGSQVLPALKETPYKWNDFTFLGLLEINPYVCAVVADSPYKTFGDLVDGIRKNPGKLKYSTAGVGTIHEMGPQCCRRAARQGCGNQIPTRAAEGSGAHRRTGEFAPTSPPSSLSTRPARRGFW